MNILFIGRGGNGKSFSINSIEKQQSADNASSLTLSEFQEYANDTSVTEKEFQELINIKAVKCSGIGDRGEDLNDSITDVICKLEDLLTESGGFNAIVIVLKYGVRFTKQEQDAVKVYDSVFGSGMIPKWGIILFTYGDLFYQDVKEDNGPSFKDWCREQTGDVQKLFEKANFRIILFDNRTKDPDQQKKQFYTLLETVRNLNAESRYTLEEFQSVSQSRETFVEEEDMNKQIKDKEENNKEEKIHEEFWLCQVIWKHKETVGFISVFAIIFVLTRTGLLRNISNKLGFRHWLAYIPFFSKSK
ncbi:uncharacterized protein LOC106050181 [Biomphalaria glabrata]|uniref:Uncharacterized protein LOC106050181 n=1 Tax=Biomphalaria glabrata TaxID=6526 RepID=A0A9U8DTN8_BIOGL|nr:uncharacterized protein LOC106050181 [Biomphalaria glabrata]